jgi:hypothetical protein
MLAWQSLQHARDTDWESPVRAFHAPKAAIVGDDRAFSLWGLQYVHQHTLDGGPLYVSSMFQPGPALLPPVVVTGQGSMDQTTAMQKWSERTFSSVTLRVSGDIGDDLADLRVLQCVREHILEARAFHVAGMEVRPAQGSSMRCARHTKPDGAH